MIRDWGPETIFEARGKAVTARDGQSVRVRLDETGWTIGDDTSLDVWNACHLLNSMGAVLEEAQNEPK